MEKGVLSTKYARTICIAGFFDPIHGGHLSHIEEAKKLGDTLIAIAGTEEQCRKKHGDIFLTWQEKVDILKKFGADYVVPNIDTDGTCAETLRKIKPDIFAKGDKEGDEPLPEKEIEVCQEIGCQILYGIGKRLNSSRKYFKK